ncbi:MAG: hypothetical protein P8J87_06230 [Verrucomicrobiales bacterium]|nr:hypothetical protein [Verrucomicrobiales bacterium]
MAAKKKTTTKRKTAKRKVAKRKVAKAPEGSRLKALWTIAGESQWFGYWKPLVMVVVVVLGILWVWEMEGLAMQRRLAREVAEHPLTASWSLQQRQLIGVKNGPVAVWGGEVVKVGMSVPPAGGVPKMVKVLLGGGTLVGGEAGKKDAEPVVIYVLGHRFAGGVPVEGERWLFSVRRDEFGSNKVYSAMRYEG